MEGLTEEVKDFLIQLAYISIRNKISNKKQKLKKLPDPVLGQIFPSFVTLKINDELRGCIGSLSTEKKLMEDIADNAVSSAFRDPRFPPLTEKELSVISIEISLLYDFQEMENKGREHLLNSLVKGETGLILKEFHRKATFLPSVWKQLPTKEMFLKHLLQKAGLPENYWSEDMHITFYKTISFSKTHL